MTKRRCARKRKKMPRVHATPRVTSIYLPIQPTTVGDTAASWWKHTKAYGDSGICWLSHWLSDELTIFLSWQTGSIGRRRQASWFERALILRTMAASASFRQSTTQQSTTSRVAPMGFALRIFWMVGCVNAKPIVASPTTATTEERTMMMPRGKYATINYNNQITII